MTCMSAGHGAIIHAATVEDSTLVGMGATILDGATVSTGLSRLLHIIVSAAHALATSRSLLLSWLSTLC